MFSCTSTNTSMSAKRRTTLLVSGRLRMPEIASASGRLLLPATSFMRVAPRLRPASRVSKGIWATTPFASGRRSSKRRRALQTGSCRAFRCPAAIARPTATAQPASVHGAGRGQELQDTLHRGAGGLVGHPAPGAVERAFGDVVLLRHGAELLAVRVAHHPLDLDRLLALA